MGTRTVRLDDETEKLLQEIIQATGLSISAALKKGLLVLQDEISRQVERTLYDIYRELDLGPGGYAIGPSTQTRLGVKGAIKKKLKR
ncbi:MAG TPA: hypothetical protein VNN20_03445 [Thermodesulfobacteriota bacterium]|nr:hypothetical protein [Thermodesulfobacteriota bacterium]